MILQISLGPAVREGRLPMQQLVDEHPESPNVGLGPVDVVDEAFWRHVDGRANVYIPEVFPGQVMAYLVNLAKPKSAILALPLCRKTLATLRSLWMTFFCARYSSPEKMSFIMGWALFSEKKCSLRSLLSRSPPLQISVMMQQFRLEVKTSQQRRMLGWFSFFSTSISEKSSCSSFCDLRELSSMILMATVSSMLGMGVLVISLWALQTLEKLPWPSRSENLKMQFWIFLQMGSVLGRVSVLIMYFIFLVYIEGDLLFIGHALICIGLSPANLDTTCRHLGCRLSSDFLISIKRVSIVDQSYSLYRPLGHFLTRISEPQTYSTPTLQYIHIQQPHPSMLPSSPSLYLVEPDDQLSYQLATLRNQLHRSNIKYQLLIGLSGMKDLLGDRQHSNIFVINSSKLTAAEVPRQYVNAYGNQIYMYPREVGEYRVLRTPGQVVDLYESKRGGLVGGTQVGPARSISLRSIKKDLQRSKQKKPNQQFYDQVLVMHPKGYNPQFQQLFNCITSYQASNKKIQSISRENEAQQYRDGRSLLILQKDAYESVNSFLIDNRLDKSVDLAVLGLVRDFVKKKNHAIATEKPIQIIKYLKEAGIYLPNIEFKWENNYQVGTTREQVILTFGKRVDDKLVTSLETQNMKNQAIMQQLEAKKKLQRPQSKQIPLVSKYTEAEKTKKTAKKVKKIGQNSSNNSSAIQQNSQDQSPTVNAHKIDSDASQRISLANQLNFDERPVPVVTTVPLSSRPPLPQNNQANGSPNGGMIAPPIMKADSMVQNLLQSNHVGLKQTQPLAEVKNAQQIVGPTNANTNGIKFKPQMHWSLYPDKNKKSPNFNGPLFVLKKQPENGMQDQFARAETHHSAKDQPNPNFAKQQSNPQSAVQNSTNQFLQKQQPDDPNDSSLLNPPEEYHKQKQKIEQKYNLGPSIRELSEEYRGSNLSFPVEDNRNSLTYSSSTNYVKLSQHTEAQQRGEAIGDPFHSQHTSKNSNGGDSQQSIRMRNNSAPVLKYQHNSSAANTALSTMPMIVEQSSNGAAINQNAPTRVEPGTRVISHPAIRPEVYYQQESSSRKDISYGSPAYNISNTTNTNVQRASQGQLYGQTEGLNYSADPLRTMSTTLRQNAYAARTEHPAATSTVAYNYTQPAVNNQYRRQSSTTITNSNTNYIQPTIHRTQMRETRNLDTTGHQHSSATNNAISANIRNYMAGLGIAEDNYEVITDANGKTVYKIKTQSTTTFNTPASNQANMNTYASPVANTTVNSSYTETLNRYKSEPKFQAPVETNSIPSRAFNWEDYDQHVDERGRKYYTVKKQKHPASSLGQNLPLQSKSPSKIQPILTAHTLTQRNYEKSTNGSLASPVYSDRYTNVSTHNPYAYSSNGQIQIRTVQGKNTPVTQRSYNASTGAEGGYARLGSWDKSDNYENYSRRVDEQGVVHQVTEKFHKTPTTIVEETRIHEYRPVVKKSSETIAYEASSTRPSIYNRLESANSYSSANRNSQLQGLNQADDTSGASRDSLLTDSRVPSVSKIFNAHLYGDNKYYMNSTTHIRLDSQQEINRWAAEFKILEIRNNFTHFIVDTGHPLRHEIEGMADVQDKIAEVAHVDKVYEYMLKKPLPNDFYDIGLVFLGGRAEQVNIAGLTQGYYLVNIAQANPALEIKKQRKTIYLRSLQNLRLAQKLILAPNIQHYIFYPRTNDPQVSKTLNLFPSAKFQKFTYSTRTQLDNLVSMHLKNKGRLSRVLIFVTASQIAEIQPVLDNSLNHRTFNMICCTRETDPRIRGQFPRVAFASNFDFQSYGSVMNLANNQEQAEDIAQIDRYTISNNYQNAPEARHQSSQLSRPKIYIQRPHQGVDKQIQRNYPSQYELKYFNTPSEIKQKSRDNFILLHREADNVGYNFDRNAGTLIMLGGQKGDRIPNGSVNIGTVSELIRNVL